MKILIFASAVIGIAVLIGMTAERGVHRRQRFAALQSGENASFAAVGFLGMTLAVNPVNTLGCRPFLVYFLNADLNRGIRSEGFTRAKCGNDVVTLRSK